MGPLTQEDPIGIAGGLNLYGFAGGDPINFSDPFGLFPCPWCVGALVGFGVEAVAQLASRDLNGEALGTAFVIGGLSGGLSVGSSLGRYAIQAGLSVTDGAIRAGLNDDGYGAEEVLLDAAAGVLGEGAGNVARSFVGGETLQSIRRLESGGSVMSPKGERAFGMLLSKRLAEMKDAAEAAVAGFASGVTGRLAALFGGR